VQALQQQGLVAIGLGIAREHQTAAIGGRQVDIDCLCIPAIFSITARGVSPGASARRRCLRVTCRQ